MRCGRRPGAGLFINTLPVRLDLDGTGVEASVRTTHARLSELLAHEHASLALAQRCSGVAAPAPLFSALLNYRHNTPALACEADDLLSGMEWLGGEERTNYPLTLSVEDFGEALGLTAQVAEPVSADRVCGYMQQVLEQLAEALEHAPIGRSPHRHPAGRRAQLSAGGSEPDGGGLSVGALHPRAVRAAGAKGAGGGGGGP
ncbi:hypothetical protein [Rhizobium sp. 007]|uniref:hypothetical protein n=1 Tax=Rhizobium sp. 007 TaxID=2785056 RepID=UPI0032B11F6D